MNDGYDLAWLTGDTLVALINAPVVDKDGGKRALRIPLESADEGSNVQLSGAIASGTLGRGDEVCVAAGRRARERHRDL